MWHDIKNAPMKPCVGNRGEVIVGIDIEGRVAKTFFSPSHSKGEAWLTATGEGLEEWFPLWWTELHPFFQDRDGESFEARQARHSR